MQSSRGKHSRQLSNTALEMGSQGRVRQLQREVAPYRLVYEGFVFGRVSGGFRSHFMCLHCV